MQVIGTRDDCACRIQLPFPNPVSVPYWKGTVNSCECGGPWVVVEDYTDMPARSPEKGKIYMIETNPNAPGYGNTVLRQVHPDYPTTIATLLYCYRTGFGAPWESLREQDWWRAYNMSPREPE